MGTTPGAGWWGMSHARLCSAHLILCFRCRAVGVAVAELALSRAERGCTENTIPASGQDDIGCTFPADRYAFQDLLNRMGGQP